MIDPAALIVSPEDGDLLSICWHVSNGYARGRIEGRRCYLHSEIARRVGIVGTPDHINRDRLDNRRENLRAATATENLANQIGHARRSGQYKGVVLGRRGVGWVAQIAKDHHTLGLGTYDSEIAAARAYDAAARFLFGSFARCNFDGERLAAPDVLLAEARDARSKFGVAGISFSRSENKFKVYRLGTSGKTYQHIGTFKTLDEAKAAQLESR